MSPVAELSTPLHAHVVTPLQRVIIAVAEGRSPEALDVDQVDACISEYEKSEETLAAMKGRHDERKSALIALVKAHGAVPAGAEQSKRILGRRNVATVTTSTTTSVNEDAVGDLHDYLEFDHAEIFNQLFATETKHKLIDGARNVLSAIQLPKRTHEKVLSLFGRCFDIKTKSPSLKVEVIEPAKPARKSRAAKAAM